MSDEDPRDRWARACDDAKRAVLDQYPRDPGECGGLAVLVAKDLLALAHHLSGVACKRCSGHGQRMYGSTTTWRGGIGGQMCTVDVCDRCWGTGRTDRSGPNLRKLTATTNRPPSGHTEE